MIRTLRERTRTNERGLHMDYPEIGEVFDDSFKADPYGTAVNVIAEAMKGAASYFNEMSSDEALALNDACQLLISRDAALKAMLPSPAEWDLEVDDPDKEV